MSNVRVLVRRSNELADGIRVLGVAGSLRKGSLNRAILRTAQELAPEGMVIDIFEGIGDFPFYNDDLIEEAGFPASVTAFKDRVKSADGVLFVTPEYNHGIPAVLKNAIDWASRPVGDSAWNGKPMAIMGAANAQGGTVRAQTQLRMYAVPLNMYVLPRPEVLINNARAKFDEQLNFTDEQGRDFMRQLLAAFAQWIHRLQAGLVS
jgi:chromate reductase